MDPLTIAVTTILGKYAIDKGAALIKEAGQAAANVAGKLFQKVIDRLKADPAESKNADRFVQDPIKHQQLIGEVIDEKIKADPQFAAELQALVEEFKQTGGQVTVNIGGDYINAQQVITMEDNYAPIVLGGSGNTINNRSGGTDVNAQQVDINGDVIGRDKTTQ